MATGAGGFIDSHLVGRLVELETRVRALVQYNSRNDLGLLELLPTSIQNEIEVVLGGLTDPHPNLKLDTTTGSRRFKLTTFERVSPERPIPTRPERLDLGDIRQEVGWQGKTKNLYA